MVRYYNKHGLSKTRLYDVWKCMIRRCYRPNHVSYKHYGARGIKVCVKWLKHGEGFVNFYNWANLNGYKEEVLPSGKNRWSLDRIDNDGSYEPSNCRFVEFSKQMRNQDRSSLEYALAQCKVFLTIGGETKAISEWSRISGISRNVIYRRYVGGWNHNDCLLPVGTKKPNRKNAIVLA